ncbi:MAG: hypothetical protein M1818_002812 [Claussenomyces sp. TS43310]|nr:MAG: hypothetical protein M1818_002812 [Claussenomyces sp. TS43310]
MASVADDADVSDGSDEGMMRERSSIDEEEQEQEGKGLLSSAADAGQNRAEWRLRVIWVFLASMFAIVLVLVIMIVFTKALIVGKVDSKLKTEISLSEEFRRQPTDYILDSHWDFNAQRKTREYHWTIVDRVANPDGVYRQMITINGQFPGPLIECNEGDTLVINVDNQSMNATSIHFHGLYQNGTNWMDGTPGITQCPIAPKGKFRYEFKVDGQSGTYYYHGHQSAQLADGLLGPVVIHSRDENRLQAIPYTTDRVIMVQDYYHDLSTGVLKTSLEPGNEDTPSPDGALINGQNVYDCTRSSKICDSTFAQRPTFDLAPNTNHRLRFINVGAFAWFEISLDEHSLAITEVDGTDVLPFDTTQMHLGPGQRYSTIITTNSTSEDAFWLRARMIRHCFSDPKKPGDRASEVNAIMRYAAGETDKALELEPTSRQWDDAYLVECRDMQHTNFKPNPSTAAPSKPDHTYNIRANLQIGAWRLQRGFFNTSSFRGDLKSPSLHRVMDGLVTDNETFLVGDGANTAAFQMENELVVQHKGVQVVDLVIQNFDEMNHPLHLHGHKFWVLDQGHAYFPGYDKVDLDLSNPIRRDTATVEGFGWMLIRFITDNPGIWAFHCHMAWHSEAGLVMQFLSQPEVMATREIPEANMMLCEADDIDKGAAPKDEIWYGFGHD